MKSWLTSGHWMRLAGLFVFAFFLLAIKVHSDTPWEDIEVKLYIEISDGDEDFDDEGETVERGRVIRYLVQVNNTGMEKHSGVVVLMDTPNLMSYKEGSTTYYKDEDSFPETLADIGGASALNIGYRIDDLNPGSSAFFHVKYQVDMETPDDPEYSPAWASALGKYAVSPSVSNLIETEISGDPKADINVIPDPDPPAGQSVDSGLYIDYRYILHNVGGLTATGIYFKPDQPEHTSCIENCAGFNIESLAPDEEVIKSMRVLVDTDLEGVTEIRSVGYDLNTKESDFKKDETPIIHPVGEVLPGDGDFVVSIEQVPNIILNSANGSPRADQGDLTETVYDIWYAGRQKPETYPTLSLSGSDYLLTGNGQCYQYYPNRRGASTYAYNSSGGMCEDISACPPQSESIAFSVQTTLPDGAPKLLFTTNTTSYSYGEESPDYMVNNYMKNGGTFQLPRIFTESRAIENGADGIVQTELSAIVSEDNWQYIQYDSWTCTYSCGDECTATVDMPLYRWEKVSSTPVELIDDDTTNITVYTSTAWLKTEGGHIGTNDQFTSNSLTDANYVDLGDPVIKPNFLTPSDSYTPPDESNSQYMVFGRNGTAAFASAQGEDWLQTGTEFPFLEQGEAYDREDNPRDFYEDMLTRQMYGPVKTNELESTLTGTVDIEDGVVWAQNSDLTIGQVGGAEVVFSGGQSRIYVAGDVYINANISLETSQGQSYNDITSLRIDARNIYVDGSVTNLEVMLLARGNFYSGVSKNQLRILGDVIAGQAYWQREPLLEIDPDEFNKPSEYIIEDMRKYVIPVPGDTTLPSDYNIWRQVNPATGQTLDAY